MENLSTVETTAPCVEPGGVGGELALDDADARVGAGDDRGVPGAEGVIRDGLAAVGCAQDVGVPLDLDAAKDDGGAGKRSIRRMCTFLCMPP